MFSSAESQLLKFAFCYSQPGLAELVDFAIARLRRRHDFGRADADRALFNSGKGSVTGLWVRAAIINTVMVHVRNGLPESEKERNSPATRVWEDVVHGVWDSDIEAILALPASKLQDIPALDKELQSFEFYRLFLGKTEGLAPVPAGAVDEDEDADAASGANCSDPEDFVDENMKGIVKNLGPAGLQAYCISETAKNLEHAQSLAASYASEIVNAGLRKSVRLCASTSEAALAASSANQTARLYVLERSIVGLGTMHHWGVAEDFLPAAWTTPRSSGALRSALISRPATWSTSSSPRSTFPSRKTGSTRTSTRR